MATIPTDKLNKTTSNTNSIGTSNQQTNTTAKEVPIRNTLVDAGFDNSKINFDSVGGNVTYGGNAMIKPTRVENGVSYANADDLQKAATSYLTNNGMMGIRDTLVNRGVSSDRIGWNDTTKSITIDGNDAFKPTNIVNGTSYATEKDINNLTDIAYNNTNNPIAGVTAYAASHGLQNAVTWSDGRLMVGGQQVPISYVENGKAYAKQSDIDKALADYKERSGIVGNNEVYQNWKNEYGDRIESALNDILNRSEWSYNPEEDPAYKAYRDAYAREGNRASQDIYAQIAASSGGYGSSMGASAAAQQRNYYTQQLNDRVPELMQDSYNRYLSEQELNRAALSSLLGVADNDYSKLYTANRDAISDSNAANYYDYMRDLDNRDYNRQVLTEDRLWDINKQLYANQIAQSNYDTSRYEQNADLDIRAKEQSILAQEIANNTANVELILTRLQSSGNMDTQISKEDARIMGISKKADGTYPTIREIQEVYARLAALGDSIAWNESGKQQAIDAYLIGKGIY